MRALSIVHQPDAGPGVFAEAIREAGWELAIWPLAAGAPPPADPFGFDAVLSFGGSPHPDQDDRHPWLADEVAVLGGLLGAGVPLLGVCLGAELLCRAAGGEVRRSERAEIGWHEVRVLAPDPLLDPLAPRFCAFGWHAYECRPPAGASELARSDTCLQAFRVGRCAWGIQFHAEVTGPDVRGWIDDYGADPDAVGLGIDPESLRTQTEARIAGWNAVGRGLCTRFLSAAALA